MKKSQELSDPTSCLNKAADHEPIFVIRAKDPLAAMTIRHWASMAADGTHEPDKVHEALRYADEMDAWRRAHETPINEASS